MSAPRRLGVLFGGRSVEHEVSVVSARGVLAAAADTALDCVPIGVTGDGRWLDPERSRAILDGGASRVDAGGGPFLVPEPGGGRLLRLEPGAPPVPLALDAILPLIHGWGGEDGRLQGALELAGIPYVGAGVAGSAVAMDKALAKRLLGAAGLPQVAWLEVARAAYDRDPEAVHRRVADELGVPVFVKPANGGSSVGISRVAEAAGLPAAFGAAFACDLKVVVETGVAAREIECGVIGNDEPRASTTGEVVPSGEFYDYRAKYLDGRSELRIPAGLDAATDERVRALARRAFRALDLRGFARVDFLLARSGRGLWLNEVNTLPGFTPISMFPKLWEASGMAYPELIETLVELALDHDARERPLRHAWDGR